MIDRDYSGIIKYLPASRAQSPVCLWRAHCEDIESASIVNTTSIATSITVHFYNKFYQESKKVGQKKSHLSICDVPR